MSTQALLDKIAAERDEHVAAIEAEAATKAAAIEASAEAELSALTDAAAAASAKEVAQLKRAALSRARQSGKIMVQTARREAFDEIMSGAKAAVENDAALLQKFNDNVGDLEMVLAKNLA